MVFQKKERSWAAVVKKGLKKVLPGVLRYFDSKCYFYTIYLRYAVERLACPKSLPVASQAAEHPPTTC
jgi:hypothetical protein